MKNIHFSPVVIAQAGQRRNVTSVMEAAVLLFQVWPKDRGKAYFAARRACIEALEGKATADDARAAFIAAAREVHMLIEAQAR
ncbi:DUF982 domain-containing protein (plasmid) [Phyllobacterium sp. A18/5-2]|uniref:DUF982 domain-containing protein n=1 Tax=Phyllobacterium sp. A18/5-2 TaxID=2978392 RepID=UPI0021CA532C|nr:DUF982 domain-containing protein [Phyllobacterium sp. A18/5-2]UXN66030.1 DUF982 domain-containing protein [Phyllobacterium sp. A18/5-2]